MNAFRTGVVCISAALLLSCGGDEPLVLTTIDVTLNPTTIAAGQVSAVTVAGKDQKGGTIVTGAVTFAAAPTSIATVSSTGVVTGVSAGQAVITVTAGTVSGQGIITVTPAPVATVSITPSVVSVNVGGTQSLSANTLDAQGRALSGRTVAWTTSDAAKATVASTGVVTGVALGSATITATSEGKSANATINVVASGATTCATISLGLGEVHAMTDAEKTSSCISGGTSGQEFVMIPFNRSTTAGNTVPVTFAATNTSGLQFTPTPPPASFSLSPASALRLEGEKAEIEFRARERATLAGLPRPSRLSAGGALRLTGLAATPTVGATFTLNSNVSPDLCTAARTTATATVVAVTTHVIVLSDNASPTGGFTSTELANWGQKFEDSVWTKITGNFGAPSDIDANGRVAILFTPEVNKVAVSGGVVLGLFAGRDLFQTGACAGSNVGEMFYMPVPDPNKAVNDKYTDKTGLSNTVLGTLAHEFQHLINAGRRIANNAPFEEVWLNEGLSHIAEELMFYQAFPTSSRANVSINDFTTQARVNAYNNFESQNFGRLYDYLLAPELNSAYASNDNLETRGAIWLLLRYAADLKTTEVGLWQQFTDAKTAGQTNFNAILGNITSLTHDMTIATFLDDANLGGTAAYTFPSWNFRSIFPCLGSTNTGCSNPFPLATRPLLGSPVDLSLAGGGASYLRFRVPSGLTASITGTSAGNAIPSSVDVTIIRTH